MNLALTEEQSLLSESFLTWLSEHYDFRQRTQSVHKDGGSPTAWKAWADLGWLALPLPESEGGLGGDLVTCGLLMQALGRHQVVEPMMPCIIEAAQLLARLGNQQQHAQWLPKVLAGEQRLALVHAEQGMSLPWDRPQTIAQPDGTGWRLSGKKRLIRSAAGAACWVVSALEPSGDVGLFLLDPSANGIVMKAYNTSDGGRAADIDFDNVWLDASAILGEPTPAGGNTKALERVLAESVILGCWEMTGTIQALLEQTVSYTGQRQQFGRSLSSFQVVQHRLAEMSVQSTEALAVCELASLRLGINPSDALEQAGMAHTKVSGAARYVSQQAVQLHGGMGVCEELPVASSFRHVLGIMQRAGGQSRQAVAYGRLARLKGLGLQSSTLPDLSRQTTALPAQEPSL